MRKMRIALVLAVCVIVCGSAIADNGVSVAATGISVRPEKIVGKAGEHVEIQITCDFEPASIEALEGGLHILGEKQILGGVPPDLGGPKSVPVLGLHPLAATTLKPEPIPLIMEVFDKRPPFFIKGKVFGFKLRYASGYRETYYLSTPGMLYELYEAKEYIGKPLSSYVGQYVGVYSCRHEIYLRSKLPSPGEKRPYEKIVWLRPRIEVNAITSYDATQQDYIGMLRLEIQSTWPGVERWSLVGDSYKLGLFGPKNFGPAIAEKMDENLNKRVKINGPVYKDEKVDQLLLMSIRPEPFKSTIVIGLTEGLMAVQELVLRIRDKKGAVHDVRIPIELPKKFGE